MNRLICPNCKSEQILRFGNNQLDQRYLCNQCHRTFIDNSVNTPGENDYILVPIPFIIWQTANAIAIKRGITISEYLQDVLVNEFTE